MSTRTCSVRRPAFAFSQRWVGRVGKRAMECLLSHGETPKRDSGPMKADFLDCSSDSCSRNVQ